MTATDVAAGVTAERAHAWRRGPPWTLRGRLARICAVVGLLAVIIVAFGAVMLHESRASLRYRKMVLVPASTNVQTLYRAMLDQETDARTYTITGSARSLESYDAGRTTVNLLEQQLRTLIDSDLSLAPHLTTVEQAADRWSAESGQRLVDLVDSGRQAEAVTLEKSGAGKLLFGDLRLALDVLIDAIDTRRLVAADVIDQRVDLLGVVAIGGALVAAGASLSIWWLLRRSVSVPLDLLRLETSAVAGGQFRIPITRGGPAEIDELGRSVDAMRTMLLDEIHTAFLNGVIDAEAAERTRLANDLHDDPIQRLTALQWKLEVALRLDDSTIRAAAATAVAGLTDVQLRLRGLMFQLHPPSIETDGLRVALDDLIVETFDGTTVRWELHCDDTSSMPSPMLSMTYRLIAEALRNTRKHAQATTVIVEVHLDEGISAEIVDDGLGFDVAQARDGVHRGIVIGPQLAHALGGWWQIHSNPRADPDGQPAADAIPGDPVGDPYGDPYGTTVAFWLPPGPAHGERPADPNAARRLGPHHESQNGSV